MAKTITDNISSFTVASELIYDERTRQCEKGFGPGHDDMHADSSLLRAAMDILVGVYADDCGQIPDPPQWVEELCEHANRKYRRAPIRRLVIAGALLAAEIERLERIELRKEAKKKRSGT